MIISKGVVCGSHSVRKLASCVNLRSASLQCCPRQQSGDDILWQRAFVAREAQPNCVRCRSTADSRSSCGAAAAGSPLTEALDEEQLASARSEPQECGSLEIIIGPMFAGKTSALLQRIAVHEAFCRRVLAVKSEKDTRYGASRLNTHNGLSRDCLAVATLSQIKRQWPKEYQRAEVIAVDEAQFFPDLEQFCSTAADEDRKHVIIAGLDGDFKRQRFGQILELVPQADAVTKLAGKCSYCEAAGVDRPALFSLRIAADERQEVVGGADKYAPVCRHHYRTLSEVRHHGDAATAVGQ